MFIIIINVILISKLVFFIINLRKLCLTLLTLFITHIISFNNNFNYLNQ